MALPRMRAGVHVEVRWAGGAMSRTTIAPPAAELERLAALERLASNAAHDLDDASAHEILQWAANTFGDRFCVLSSMGDAVVASLAAKAKPCIDVVFLDTVYHFAETIGMRDAVAAVYDVNVVS